MNNLLENKQNTLELAKSLKNYKKKIKELSQFKDKGVLDFLM